MGRSSAASLLPALHEPLGTAVSEVPCDVLLRPRERNAIDPVVDFVKLLTGQRRSVHIISNAADVWNRSGVHLHSVGDCPGQHEAKERQHKRFLEHLHGFDGLLVDLQEAKDVAVEEQVAHYNEADDRCDASEA